MTVALPVSAALRRAMNSARRAPRSHGIFVLDASAASIVFPIQRGCCFILLLRLTLAGVLSSFTNTFLERGGKNLTVNSDFPLFFRHREQLKAALMIDRKNSLKSVY